MKKSFLLKSIAVMIGTATLGIVYSIKKTELKRFFGQNANITNAVAKLSTLEQRVTIAGTVIANKRTVITAPYKGYVKKIFVKVGQTVKSGEPIVSVVQSLNHMDQDVYPLRAPFAGTVSQILKTEGEYVDESKEQSSIIRIDDASKLFVVADVPETEIEKIEMGQEALIKSSAILSRTYKGAIQEISLASKEKKDMWSGSTSSVEFPIRIEIMDKDSQIKPGMSVILDVVTAKKTSVLTLPFEYIEKVGAHYFVTLADGQRRSIKIGLQSDEAFEIIEGLKIGDSVKAVNFSKAP